jgi:transcriptional regulator
MHPNPAFRKAGTDRNLTFARERGFGTLAVNGPGGPLVSHVPFILSQDNARLEAHLVRSNPILRLLEQPVDAVIAVIGGDAYISPDWYRVADQVPTWNYVAVHLRGRLSKLPDDMIHEIVERTSAHFEEKLLPKQPWKTDKMDQDIYRRMLRQIVPVEMEVTTVDGTWKLSQNKSVSAIEEAAKGVEETAIGLESDFIATGMRGVAHALRKDALKSGDEA